MKCGNCGRMLAEIEDLLPEKREPCPTCGSTKRTYDCTVSDSLTASDYSQMLAKRDNKSFTYSESNRKDGRSASAELNEDGSLSSSAAGSSPQGEESTLEACRILVNKLNSCGANWGEPSLTENGHVDCQAVDADDHKILLKVQVVRAFLNSNFWQALSTQGSSQFQAADGAALADKLEETIKHKAVRIPANARSGLLLALDATLFPVLPFDCVVEEFRSSYGVWADSLGFAAIWLVGPISDLVQRLDKGSA